MASFMEKKIILLLHEKNWKKWYFNVPDFP